MIAFAPKQNPAPRQRRKPNTSASKKSPPSLEAIFSPDAMGRFVTASRRPDGQLSIEITETGAQHLPPDLLVESLKVRRCRITETTLGEVSLLAAWEPPGEHQGERLRPFTLRWCNNTDGRNWILTTDDPHFFTVIRTVAEFQQQAQAGTE